MSMERTKKRRRSVRAASGENRGLATLRRMVVGGSEKNQWPAVAREKEREPRQVVVQRHRGLRR